MSVAQDYNDWQELVTQIKATQIQLPLEVNILKDIEVVLDQDLLSFRHVLHVRYCLNGAIRNIKIPIDREYGLKSDDPIRERLMLVKRHLVEDLGDFLFMGALGKIDPTRI